MGHMGVMRPTSRAVEAACELVAMHKQGTEANSLGGILAIRELKVKEGYGMISLIHLVD